MDTVNGLFRKFTEIDNYKQKELNRWESYFEVLKQTKFVIMEKLDGSNFQIINSPDLDCTHFASRNQLIGNIKDGFNFNNMWPIIKNEHLDLIDNLLNYSHDNDLIINVYGEIFGRGIQRRINYGNNKYFKIFDISINGKYITFKEMEDLLNDLDLSNYIIPIYKITDNFQECLDFNTEIPSLHSPTNNITEGVVIKPYDKKIIKLHNEEGFDREERFIWKIKNESFTEKRAPKRDSSQLKSKDDILNEFPEIKILKEEFESYITENRLLSVISKLGELNSMNQMGLYLKEFFNDAKKDFLKDNDDKDLNESIHKLIYKDGNILCKQLIMKYLDS